MATKKILTDLHVDGNVGVGTTTPRSELSVEYTDTHSSGDLSVENSGFDIYNSTETAVEGTGATLTFSDNYLASGTYLATTRAAIKGGKESAGNSSNGFLAFYTDRGSANSMAEKMRIKSDGKVGIGTNIPNSLLTIEESDGEAIMQINRNDDTINNSDRTGIIQFGAKGSWDLNLQVARIQSVARETFTSTANGTSLSFFTTELGSSTSTFKMIIDTNGHVGVGTGTPSAKLTVRGTSTTSEDLFHIIDGGGVRMMDVVTDASGNANVQVKDTAGTTKAFLNSAGDTYFNGGDVGIGLVNPTEKLHVNGDAKADSFIKDGGTSSQFLKADGSVDSNTYLTSGSVSGFIDGSGSAGKLPKFTDSNTVEDSIITEDSSKIGIGVASPKAALHVNGAVIIGNDTTAASADLAGALRYWDEVDGGTVTSYVDMCMKHACGYEWTNIVTNRTMCI